MEYLCQTAFVNRLEYDIQFYLLKRLKPRYPQRPTRPVHSFRRRSLCHIVLSTITRVHRFYIHLFRLNLLRRPCYLRKRENGKDGIEKAAKVRN